MAVGPGMVWCRGLYTSKGGLGPFCGAANVPVCLTGEKIEKVERTQSGKRGRLSFREGQRVEKVERTQSGKRGRLPFREGQRVERVEGRAGLETDATGMTSFHENTIGSLLVCEARYNSMAVLIDISEGLFRKLIRFLEEKRSQNLV